MNAHFVQRAGHVEAARGVAAQAHRAGDVGHGIRVYVAAVWNLHSVDEKAEEMVAAGDGQMVPGASLRAPVARIGDLH
jgi:hypothetical protein